MDLSSISGRLKSKLVDIKELREVGQAIGLNAVMTGRNPMPAIYIVPLSEKGDDIETTGAASVLEHRLFSVIYVVDVRNDVVGTRAATDLALLRQRVKTALIGFVPDDVSGEAVTFVGGELIEFSGDGRLFWSDEFVFKGYFLSTTP